MARSSCVVVAALILCRAGRAQPDATSIPPATPIAGTALCAIDGWQYAPRWDVPGNGLVTQSPEECARACEANPVCTGATYLAPSSAQLNCWFKDWGTGAVAAPCLPGPQNPLEVQAIIDPAGAECSGITYMAAPVFQCDAEPGTPSSSTARALGLDAIACFLHVELRLKPKWDIGPGMRVDTITDCEAACDNMPTCTAAAFLYKQPNTPDNNCYPKVMAETCGLPEDSKFWSVATLSLKCEHDLNSNLSSNSTLSITSGSPEAAAVGADASNTTFTDAATSADATVVPLVGGSVAALVFVLTAIALLLVKFMSSTKTSKAFSSINGPTGSHPHKDGEVIVARSPPTHPHSDLPFLAPQPHTTFTNDTFEALEAAALAYKQQQQIQNSFQNSKNRDQNSNSGLEERHFYTPHKLSTDTDNSNSATSTSNGSYKSNNVLGVGGTYDTKEKVSTHSSVLGTSVSVPTVATATLYSAHSRDVFSGEWGGEHEPTMVYSNPLSDAAEY